MLLSWLRWNVYGPIYNIYIILPYKIDIYTLLTTYLSKYLVTLPLYRDLAQIFHGLFADYVTHLHFLYVLASIYSK